MNATPALEWAPVPVDSVHIEDQYLSYGALLCVYIGIYVMKYQDICNKGCIKQVSKIHRKSTPNAGIFVEKLCI